MRRRNLRLEALLKSQAENTRKLISKISMMITLQRARKYLEERSRRSHKYSSKD